MLRASTLDFGGNWDKQVSLMKFAYNNSYQTSLNMAPFEAMYGKKCKMLIYWEENWEKKLFGPELVQMTTDNIQVIQADLKAA